ncbi:MAG: aminotransferase class V-fold PLP-dependent enzyme, partial [Clostridia bacterium]|nr:aminotransferase class V-fold PLP-dependent enzyme [Clostridia bacterium]
GIIRESERNYAALFGAGASLYSTEGSSQCIRAMVHLAANAGHGRTLLAARNAHKAFVYACALADANVRWLYPEGESSSVCACPVSPGTIANAIDAMPQKPCAVYLTSPDYLGGLQDIKGAAEVCHARGVPLLVDNAHGAYLQFLSPSLHPMALGADLCCDSAHKTLPALTGAAALHLKDGSEENVRRARAAMALHGSTSPSYLILESLDRLCGETGAQYHHHVQAAAAMADEVRKVLAQNGWTALPSDPLRVTVPATDAMDGFAMAQALRRHGAECEYADRDHLVCMLTWRNTPEEAMRIPAALGKVQGQVQKRALPAFRGEAVLSIREAVFACDEVIPTASAVGRVCASPAVACPPAIPIVCAGERITREAAMLLAATGNQTISVVKA